MEIVNEYEDKQEKIRERKRLTRYLIAAEIASRLKCLDKEANFSLHLCHAFFRELGRTVAVLKEEFSFPVYQAKKIAERILLTYLRLGLPYPKEPEKEYLFDSSLFTSLRPFSYALTVDKVKPTCIYHIKKYQIKEDPEKSWSDIVSETKRVTNGWLTRNLPPEITEDAVNAHLCLFVSRFYGKIPGKQIERRDDVRYFFEREILDVMTYEGLEIDYVLTQREKRQEKK